MKILVTGGAGYIGSFMVKRLLEDNHEVIIADSLERGYETALQKKATFVQGNLGDQSYLDSLFTEYTPEAVIHFAAYIAMGESMEQPYMYFNNNTFNALKLLENANKNGVKKIIFSSTAGVYGSPVEIPIKEDNPKNPGNPYGESKLMVERLLHWYQKVHNLSFVVLRYFNACGAALDGSMGEQHKPETHIIPNVIAAALENRDFTLFGDDYKTPDGTCVRDYIHVLDLIEAHVLALQKIINKPGGYTYNVGTGKGYSNKEIVEVVKRVSQRDIQVQTASRRPGDADTLIADASRIMQDLNFSPKYSDLDTIITSAWKWHSSRSELDKNKI